MRKQKGSKIYDTDSAMCVGTFENGKDDNPSWYKESLYRKKTGEFFLAGEGNWDSKYAIRDGRSTVTPEGRGYEIFPLDKDDAAVWAKKHGIKLPKELLDDEYGKKERAGITISVIVAKDAKGRLDAASERLGVPRAKLIERLIMEHL